MTCPECGSNEITIDPDGTYRCRDCDLRFNPDLMEQEDEELEEDLGLLGEPDEEW